MTLDEIIAKVYDITGRPDLVSSTFTAIQSATLKAHQSDYYPKDIYETPIQFSSKEFNQSLDIISLVPNYRSAHYMRHLDPVTLDPGEIIKAITPKEILDRFNRQKTNVYYEAGRVLEIRSLTEFDTILFGCYVSPPITAATYLSWIADLYPFTIIHEAARQVFIEISLAAEAKGQSNLVADQYRSLATNGLTTEAS